LTALFVLLAVAPFALAEWSIEDVDSPREIDRGSLELDPLGNPAVAYGYDVLVLARWNGTNWDIQVLDSVGSVGSGSSLVLDTAGNPVIAYYGGTGGVSNLKLA
jgi:hypothetical protein